MSASRGNSKQLTKGDAAYYAGQLVILTSEPRWCSGGRCVDAKWTTADNTQFSGTLNYANLIAVGMVSL